MAGKDCDEALDRLYEFIDNELPDEDLHRIGEHLHTCPPCHDELVVSQRIKDLVSQHPKETAPDELRSRILATIREVREGD